MIRKRRKTEPTIYLDTNVITVMFCTTRFVSTAHQQSITREWWSAERKSFRIFGSAFLEEEVANGEYVGQQKAILLARSLPYLPLTAAVRAAARQLVGSRVIPSEKLGDALHLAIATKHEIDYLLTWNYAHLANIETQRKLNQLCSTEGWRPPVLVSPESIPKIALGQEIWRKE